VRQSVIPFNNHILGKLVISIRASSICLEEINGNYWDGFYGSDVLPADQPSVSKQLQ